MKKIIVISGGSDGLGYSIAKKLSPNHTVIILSPTQEKLEKVSKELNCDFEICDVSDDKSIESAINNIVKKYKKIDCLINNAGVWIQGKLVDNSSEDIEKTIAVNTTGVILLSRAVIPYMEKNKGSLIINVVSQAGLYGNKERSVYVASKFAITGFTKSLEKELAVDGIRVSGFYPGKLKTTMFEKMGIKKDISNGLPLEEVVISHFYLLFTTHSHS